MVLFPTLPNTARTWIYVADRSLDEDTVAALYDHMQGFTSDWRSHGRPVDGDIHVLENRFVVLAAQILDGDLSGCGIDASVHALEAFAAERGFAWLPSIYILYRDQHGAIQTVDRISARKKVKAGEIGNDTVVFDTSIETLGALRETGLEKRAADSWHATILRLPVAQ